MAPTSIPLYDAYVLFVEASQHQQSRESDLATGRATTCTTEARAQVHAKPMDVAVMDVLPWPEGAVAVAAQAKSVARAYQILTLNIVDSSTSVVETRRVDASSCSSTIVDIDHCVRSPYDVTQGDRSLSPTLVRALPAGHLRDEYG